MVKGNQQKILDAFYDLAMQNPNEANLSMSDLAKKAGISRQAIYKHHFNSVDDIIESIHESIDKPVYEALNKALYDINHRPRKCLAYRTASEALEDEFE